MFTNDVRARQGTSSYPGEPGSDVRSHQFDLVVNRSRSGQARIVDDRHRLGHKKVLDRKRSRGTFSGPGNGRIAVPIRPVPVIFVASFRTSVVGHPANVPILLSMFAHPNPCSTLFHGGRRRRNLSASAVEHRCFQVHLSRAIPEDRAVVLGPRQWNEGSRSCCSFVYQYPGLIEPFVICRIFQNRRKNGGGKNGDRSIYVFFGRPGGKKRGQVHLCLFWSTRRTQRRLKAKLLCCVGNPVRAAIGCTANTAFPDCCQLRLRSWFVDVF